MITSRPMQEYSPAIANFMIKKGQKRRRVQSAIPIATPAAPGPALIAPLTLLAENPLIEKHVCLDGQEEEGV